MLHTLNKEGNKSQRLYLHPRNDNTKETSRLFPRTKKFSKCCWAEPNPIWDPSKPSFATGSTEERSAVQLWACNIYASGLEKDKSVLDQESVLKFEGLGNDAETDICIPKPYDVLLIDEIDTTDVVGLSWATNSSLLISAHLSGEIYILRAKDSKLEKCVTIQAHGTQECSQECTSMAVSPFHDNIISSVDSSNTLVFHDIEGNKISSFKDVDYAQVYALCWRNFNDIILSNSYGVISLFDRRIENGKGLNILAKKYPDGIPINCLAVSPSDRNIIVSGSSTGTLNVWDIRYSKNDNVYTSKVHSSEIVEAKFDQNKKDYFMTASQDGCFSTFSLSSLEDVPKVDIKKESTIRTGGGFLYVTSFDINRHKNMILSVTETGGIFFIPLK